MSNQETKTIEPTENVEKKAKTYSGLGEAMKKQDFQFFYEELNNWKKNDTFDYKRLFDRVASDVSKVGFGNQIDSLLHNIPLFALDEKTKELKPYVKECIELLVSLGGLPLLEFKNGPYGKSNTNMVRESAKLPNPELLKVLFDLKLWEKIEETNTVSGFDLLHAAVNANSPTVIEYLVKEKGFDVNKKYFFSNNSTLIFFAIGRGLEEAYDKLVELGADIQVKNGEDFYPIDFLETKSENFEEMYAEEPEEKEKHEKFSARVMEHFDKTAKVVTPKKKLRTAF
jgi:hypothetical protein